MLQLNAKLKSLIEKLWDRFWSGGISNPLSAIEQITYLLFMKQLDELDLDREKNADFTGDSYTSRFSGNYYLPQDRARALELETPKPSETAVDKKLREQELQRLAINKDTLRWSHFKEMKAELMLPHVQLKVFPFIKDLNGEGSTFTRHMANAVFIIPSANLLQGAIQIIEDIFIEIERDARESGHLHQDIQGDVYEMLLSEISSAGKNGQFRTPRHIIKLVSELVNPQLGHRICDPACGTAGFLLDAYQYIITQLAKQKAEQGQNFPPDEDGFIRTSVSGQLTQDNKDILEQNLHGFDFDSTMVRLALMNLMMHGIDNPHVDYQDTLSKSFTEEGDYDIIMANPPFTGSIDKGDINESLQLKTTKTELLFTERIFTLLKTGGTAGVIIPQGVLFGSSGAFVELRKKLVEEAELKAVISLPSGVFKPYAGVATAILIFTRGGKTEHTWFYNLTNDGLSLDDKRQRIAGSQLPDVVEKWRGRDPQEANDRKANHFFVPAQKIRDKAFDLSFNRYSKVEPDDTIYEEPKVILGKLKMLEDKIQQGINELEEILKMKVGELFTIRKGKKPPELFDSPPSELALPFFKIDALRDRTAHQFCEFSPNLVTCDRQDVLLVWDGAYSGLAASGLRGAVGSTIARLRPKDNRILGSYAGEFFRSKFSEIQHNATGAAIPHVNGTHLREMDFPRPPLNEQKRVAAVLGKANTLRRQRQKSLQFTETLLQSVFIDMFVRNPNAADWTPRTVTWMAKEAKGAIRTGPFGSQLLHSEFVDRGIAVLGIDNAVNNRFEWGKSRFITPEKYQDLQRYKVFPGDLIITIMGTLGRCAIVPDDIPEAINTKHLCCITLDDKKCLPDFLHAAFLNHPDVLRQLGVRAKGAVMPGLNMGIIKGLEVPLPPIELQLEFKRIVAFLLTSRLDLEDSQSETEALFASIQQCAFRGELDLSRLKLDGDVELPVAAIAPGHSYNEGVYNRPGFFIAPPEIEAQMMELEERLNTGPGDSIPWSEEYFKYRILSQLLHPPFNFAEIWERVFYDMEEAHYETVKDKVFEYVEAGILDQQFDEERKEIVFHPRP